MLVWFTGQPLMREGLGSAVSITPELHVIIMRIHHYTLCTNSMFYEHLYLMHQDHVCLALSLCWGLKILRQQRSESGGMRCNFAILQV
jgi:hypothetical protein